MQAAVIGAGIAGLAGAARLRARGYEVSVYETNAYPGGKLSQFDQKGYRFDAGPSLFTLPHLVDDVFRSLGENPRDHFQYKSLPEACRYFWEDGTRLTAWTDPEKFAAEVETNLGVKAEVILKYLAHARNLYDLTAGIFLEKSLHKTGTYFSTDVLRALTHVFSLDLNKTMDKANQKKLKHPKLVQLFNRFATYNGSSPYLAPGVLNIIPHLEHNLGTWFPEGGMYAITQSITDLAERHGVKIHYNTPVDSIVVNGQTARGIKTKGKFVPSDLVVSNMDIVPTYRKLLQKQPAPEKTLNQERSSSALIYYWGIRRDFPELSLHNIFFSEDYAQEFEHIFKLGTVFDDPTIYVNISSVEAPEDAPPGCQNWFVMVNVPGNTGQNWDEIQERTRTNVLAKLTRILGVPIADYIQNESVLDPRTIESRTSSWQGSLYGASSNNKFSAFLRHPNFSPKIKNLYFLGGSVHPGGGIPLCLLSAKIVSELVPAPSV